MSQNWLSNNLWPKTTNVASVASNGISDLKSAKADASNTFQSLLAGKLGDKIQSNSPSSRFSNSLGEMKVSKKLETPSGKGIVKSSEPMESKSKSEILVTKNEKDSPAVAFVNQKEDQSTKSDSLVNKKSVSQNDVEESKEEVEKSDRETVDELNAFANYLIAEASKMPELEQLMNELGKSLGDFTAGVIQNQNPEVLLNQMKGVLEAIKTLQSVGNATQTAMSEQLKTTLDQLVSSLEKNTGQSIPVDTFETVLKELNSILKENNKDNTVALENVKENRQNPETVVTETETDSIKMVSSDSKDQKTSNNGQGNDSGNGKQKSNEIVKVTQESKQTSEAKTNNQNFASEMNAKIDSSSISFGKTETAIGKTTLQQNILDQIINSPRMQVKQTDLGTIMTMKLNPEVLGNVEIKLEIIKNVLQAEINVENMIVKGAIESNLTDLKNALSDKGYQVENLNVSVSKDGQDQRGGQQRQNEQAQRYVIDEDDTAVSKSFKMTSLNENGTIDYLG